MTLTMPAATSSPPAPRLYDFAAITPWSRPCVFSVRDQTVDQNTVQSCVNEDEYALRDVELGTGTAVDVGAYIGAVSVALALDNPGAHIIAVEPVPENVAMIRRNAERNGVQDRVTVLERAVCKPRQRTMEVQSAFTGTESATQNAWIGSTVPELLESRGDFRIDDRRTEAVKCVDLAALVRMAGGRIAFLKIDCEGGEYELFASPALRDVGLIRGEHHLGYDRLVSLLDATHVVTGDADDLGHFEARPR